ncbi:MAG: 30S ribosomal protein S6 [Bacteriovoracaceae bacterium]
MIYETALVLRTDIDEATANSVKAIVSDVVTNAKGEILVNDDWGVKTFPQTLGNNHKKGHYVYFMYKANTQVNNEIERRLRINEHVIRSLIVKLGDDKSQENIVKAYKTPGYNNN